MEQTGEKQMQKEERNMTGRHYRKTTNFIPPHCSENNSTTTHVRRRSFRLTLCLFFALILLTAVLTAVWLLPRLHSNQFSKNIPFSSAYFLSQFREGASAKEESDWYGEMLLDTEASSFFWDSLNEFSSSADQNELFQYCYSAVGPDAILIIRDYLGLSDEDFRFLLHDVPYLSQENILPNGCEAVCADMLLQNCGFSLSPEAFVQEALPMEPVYLEWGCRYGPDPTEAYAGDPFSETGGWGCFAPVIEKALQSCTEGSEWQAVNLTGLSLEEIFQEVVLTQRQPAAVWVTIDMEETTEMYQWQSYDHTETYLYPVNQHCMVLVGRDAECYLFYDPNESNGLVRYPVETAEERYRTMGSQCVALLPDDAAAG